MGRLTGLFGRTNSDRLPNTVFDLLRGVSPGEAGYLLDLFVREVSVSVFVCVLCGLFVEEGPEKPIPRNAVGTAVREVLERLPRHGNGSSFGHECKCIQPVIKAAFHPRHFGTKPTDGDLNSIEHRGGYP